MTRLRGWVALAMVALCAQAASADDASFVARQFEQLRLWQRVQGRAQQLFQEGRFVEGVIAAEESLKLAEQAFEPDDQRVIETLALLAAYYRQQGRTDAADALDGRILTAQRQVQLERHLGFPMVWRYGSIDTEWPDCRHVVFRFVDFPGHVLGIYSKDLGQYLESLGTNQVFLQFDVAYDPNGQLKRYRVAQIGDLTRWQSEFQYAGAEYYGGASPWTLPAPQEPSDDAADDATPAVSSDASLPPRAN